MLLFPRRCRYWHLHLHVHTDSHFTFANQHFEHVGTCASLTNHLISLCRHCTFLCHSSSPSPPFTIATTFHCLPRSQVWLHLASLNHPVFMCAPSPGSHRIKRMRNVELRSWSGLPVQPHFQWSYFLGNHSKGLIYPEDFCWNVLLFLKSKTSFAFQIPLGSQNGFQVLDFRFYTIDIRGSQYPF